MTLKSTEYITHVSTSIHHTLNQAAWISKLKIVSFLHFRGSDKMYGNGECYHKQQTVYNMA